MVCPSFSFVTLPDLNNPAPSYMMDVSEERHCANLKFNVEYCGSVPLHEGNIEKSADLYVY